MINLQYLYLNECDPSSQVMFQDQNSQIVGVKFKRNDLNELSKNEVLQDINTNNSIYFLISEDEMYIGKSVNGFQRIKNHKSGKLFWDYGLIFTADNSSWTSTTIDYLEYHFINKFKQLATYTLVNVDERNKEPNLTKYDKASINSAIDKVDFYLNCHGINTDNKIEVVDSKDKKYSNKEGTASIVFKNDKFVLLKGTKLSRPNENAKKYSDNGSFYNRYFKQIENLLETSVIDSNLVTTKDLEFQNPSRIASLIAGVPLNGWEYFIDLNELRDN